jgi:exopolyphosphatase/guanosine-5'-triphosphate,3'-diphosphate pyrophosphatase
MTPWGAAAGTTGVARRQLPSNRRAIRGYPTCACVRRTTDDPTVSWRTTRATAGGDGRNQQVAVIDLGSNSWRLVIFTFVPGQWWKRTDELYETVRIGAGMGDTGRLREDAIERGLETLSVFERFCRASGIDPENVHPIATSAIRDAVNRGEFLARAGERTGLQVEILSEQDEARFGYVAAINTSTLVDGAVLELGGGSMQLIEVVDRRAHALCSFELGAVRLTEKFLPGSGPAKKKELQQVRAHVRQVLADVDWLPRSGERLVGIGGAVRNLAAAAQRRAGQIDIGIQGFVLTRDALAELVKALAAMPVAERGDVSGIKPGRGDIILAAALVIETVLEMGSFDGIEVTEAGLREGAFLARELLADKDEPLFDNVRAAAVRNLAIQYESDMEHVCHVARLSLQMFDSLVEDGLFEPAGNERELLWAASMLHDVGMTISYDDHHKHSRYLIVSAELPGFDPRERALIAQISRYHRKGAPKLGDIAALSRDGDEELLERCAVILRLAEHLERSRDQSVREARLRTNGHGVDLHLQAAGDLTVPRWSVERYGDGEIFERVFGRRLLIG